MGVTPTPFEFTYPPNYPLIFLSSTIGKGKDLFLIEIFIPETHKEKAVATLDQVWTEKTNYTKTIQSEEQKECLSAVSH